MNATLWTNHPFSNAGRHLIQQRLADEASDVTLQFSVSATENNLGAGDPDPQARSADILWGQPAVEDVTDGRARWIALTSAGYTRYDNDAVRKALKQRNAVLSNASGVYDEPCAQHVLAQILAESRQLPQCLAEQARRQWDAPARRENSFLLKGQRLVILGFGAIARRLVELLAPFRMELTGVRRHPTGQEAVECITPDGLDQRLGRYDHIVNILPASEGTRQFVSESRIAKMQPSAVYYSIGRGATTDHAALRAALEAGRLRAAYLDVFETEPLPPQDPLWQTPGCIITPHSAGGFAEEEQRLIDHFFAGLHQLGSGGPVDDRVL